MGLDITFKTSNGRELAHFRSFKTLRTFMGIDLTYKQITIDTALSIVSFIAKDKNLDPWVKLSLLREFRKVLDHFYFDSEFDPIVIYEASW